MPRLPAAPFPDPPEGHNQLLFRKAGICRLRRSLLLPSIAMIRAIVPAICHKYSMERRFWEGGIRYDEFFLFQTIVGVILWMPARCFKFSI